MHNPHPVPNRRPAVDNVLERFIKLNDEQRLVSNEKILRVATDSLKVSKALQDYTIDARVGGDLTENNRLIKKAQERVKSAKIVFTTCAGAGLGILRKPDFDVVIIDEASQITEACALIPLVKGCKKAVLVGDQCVFLLCSSGSDIHFAQRSTSADGSEYGKGAAARRFDARAALHRSKCWRDVQDDAEREFAPDTPQAFGTLITPFASRSNTDSQDSSRSSLQTSFTEADC